MSDVPAPKNRQPLRLQFWLSLCIVSFGTLCANVSLLHFHLMAANPLFGVNSTLQMQYISDWTHSLIHSFSMLLLSFLNFSASWLPYSFHFPHLADRTPSCLPVLRISAYWFSGLQSTLDPKSEFSEACLQAACPCYKLLIFLWKLLSHLFCIQCFLTIYYVLGIVLGAGIATVNKTLGAHDLMKEIIMKLNCKGEKVL